jgi:hypothetical protein
MRFTNALIAIVVAIVTAFLCKYTGYEGDIFLIYLVTMLGVYCGTSIDDLRDELREMKYRRFKRDD